MNYAKKIKVDIIKEINVFFKKNKWLPKIKLWIDENDSGSVLIPFSGAFELKIIEMDDGTRADYLKEVGATSALDKIVKTGYKALCLEYFFTAGKDEVRAWTIQVFFNKFFFKF